MKGALSGFGQVAANAHAPALNALGVEVKAIAEQAPARREAAAAAFPKAKIYESLDALLSSEKGLDFVLIATPPSAHGPQTLAALKAGLHVLCEKPLTFDPGQYEEIARASKEADRAAFTVHNWAHSPQWLKVFELVESGVLGEIRHAELHVLRAQPAAAAAGSWRTDAKIAGGGILVDHGWHNFYLLNRLIKANPARVLGHLAADKTSATEDDAAVFIEYPAATALVRLSWRAGVRSNSALVVGSKGALELSDDKIVLKTREGEKVFPFDEKLSAGSAHPEWTRGLLREFMRAVEDLALRERNLAEAGFCLRMIERVYSDSRPQPKKAGALK